MSQRDDHYRYQFNRNNNTRNRLIVQADLDGEVRNVLKFVFRAMAEQEADYNKIIGGLHKRIKKLEDYSTRHHRNILLIAARLERLEQHAAGKGRHAGSVLPEAHPPVITQYLKEQRKLFIQARDRGEPLDKWWYFVDSPPSLSSGARYGNLGDGPSTSGSGGGAAGPSHGNVNPRRRHHEGRRRDQNEPHAKKAKQLSTMETINEETMEE